MSSSARSCSTRFFMKSERTRSDTTRNQRFRLLTSRLQRQHAHDGCGDTIPVRHFLVQLLLAGPCQRIELCSAIVLSRAPLTFDPAFLFELVECRIKRTVAHLQNIVGHLQQPLPDRPAVEWLKDENFENQ